jgi:UDP-N-acetylmuramoylalanine--D-glutamate ligase
MPGLKPDVGILINLTPDHLDRHGDMDNYASIKARMFMKQDADDTAVIGVDDRWCADIAMGIANGTKLRAVSVLHEMEDGISAVGGILREWQIGAEVARIDLRLMPALKGAHNWQNACMAYGAARAFGMGVAEIRNAMESFPGLAHRMQEIGCLGYVPFINDSKATNADAAAKALASFENIFWIAGGIAKAGGIAPLSPFFPRIAKAYLIGEAADEFARTLADQTQFELCGTLDKAVFAAARDAVNSELANAVVLLSPACASFDHYRNFEIRGDAFVRLVSELPGIVMTIKGDP